MSDELKRTLPDRQRIRERPSKAIVALLILVATLAAANLFVALKKGAGPSSGELASSKLKEVALKLEQRDVKDEALLAWREVATSRELNAEDRAKVWYRIGSLEQEAGRDGAALDAYYRSEAQAALKDIAPDIAVRVQQCLEHSGKFADLQHELRERTAPLASAPKASDVVVAEIGPRKEQEVQGDLFSALGKKYDVVLHSDALGRPSATAAPSGIKGRKTPL